MSAAFALVLLLAAGAAFVDATKTARGIRLDVRYATKNNFTHQQLYPAPVCYLRPETARKLAAAERDAESLGLRLKVFDCYRPLSIQRRMWALVPDERYVADPAKGSRHNRGAAVDLTLVRADGTEVRMPTGYDDFTERAHRDFERLPSDVKENRALLERIMTRHGFIGMPTEWWHFDDAEWNRYAVEDTPIPQR